MRALHAILIAIPLALCGLVPASSAAESTTSHALSLFGDIKYPPDFKHFDYVNPDAPKGGTARFAAVGSYDNLNQFIIKGVPAAGIGNVFDTLMTQSLDEPATEYGLLAESVEVAQDRSWVIYTLRKEARFNDGSPVTPDDVIWTFETLRSKGRPQYRGYYADVGGVEPVGERGVKFILKNNDNRELPQIIGELPVLPKKWWATREFDKTTLEPPLGSGPYKVEAVDPGRSITYRRVADYWGANLPVNRGRNDFDVMRYDYYRDPTVSLEAFKAGQYDFRLENSSKDWATGYDGPGLKEGLIKKEQIPNSLPTGMQAFGYNTRRPIFQDPRLRRALDYAFDFEWSNKTLFYGAYTRTESYFSNSDLASSGLPGEAELAVLEKYRGKIPDAVFTTPYREPKTDGSGNIRDNLREALRLLKEAGWSVKADKLVNDKTGAPLEFEMLLDNPQFERVVLPFAQNLKRLGVEMKVRTVDSAQYQKRMDDFDYDMAIVGFGQSLSPGNEQRDYWGSKAADEPGSRNLLGVRDPVVDELVDLVIAASDRADLVAKTRSLDRVLLNSYYVIPNWHIRDFRVAYWSKFLRPSVNPPYGIALNAWWIDPAKEASVEARKSTIKQ
jgi:microcin C transport system substrate-binding protein